MKLAGNFINGALVGVLAGPMNEPKYWICFAVVVIGNLLIGIGE